MNKFDNLKTGKKLIVSFASIVGFLLLLGVLSVVGMTWVSDRTETIYKINLLPIKLLGDLQERTQRMSAYVSWHILAYDSATVAKQVEGIAKVDEEIEELVKAYNPVIVSESERKYVEQFITGLSEYKEVRVKVLQLSTNFSKDAASELQKTQLAEKLEKIHDAVKGLIRENEQQAKDSFETSQTLSWSFTVAVIVFCILASAVGIFGSMRVTRFIVGSLSNVLQATQELQNGNLTHRSSLNTTEEIGQLALAFNQMAGTLEQAAAKQAEALAAQAAEISGVTSAISKAQAVIEFSPDGTVLTANDLFLQCLGYSLDEIKGRHHRMFCDPADISSEEYAAFWKKLGRGEYASGAYRRRRKDGKDVWLQAWYNPILDAAGKPYKVIKYATDITAQKQAALESEGILKAIDRGQALIEFNMDGTVRNANQIFLNTLGYALNEIKGQHHRMFCEPAYTNSQEYAEFWKKLNGGEFNSGVYKRVGKGGKEVWIQCTYNPIFDLKGKPYKVVKFATDITDQKRAAMEMEQLVKDAQEVLGRLASNDLTQEMTETYSGDLEKIKTSINEVVRNLTRTITVVRAAVESVMTGSEEITKGSEDLAQRTSEQASSLEETAASMEEMTSTVKQNADNAKQADKLAISARDTADKGGSVTQRAVEAMGEINKSSKKIADIITVIDEIAFQTNLLALNAAVEAARAGEHGRGFAVVAAEVRNLAQRSATAAKEIKGLINESIQRVTDGSELVHQSGKTLEEIVHAVKRVTDIIAEISVASQEQAGGIDQVNKAILSMDESTQQNAALVEETTSAAQSMKEQAKELLQQVRGFKISEVEGNHVGHSPGPVKKDLPQIRPRLVPQISASVGHRVRKSTPAVVAVGNGKDRRSSDNEFDEF
jgi:methyl-accepting chemotaxis protein